MTDLLTAVFPEILKQYGLMGLVVVLLLAWVLYMSTREFRGMRKDIQQLTTAVNRLTQTQLIDLVESPTAHPKAKTRARSLLEELGALGS